MVRIKKLVRIRGGYVAFGREKAPPGNVSEEGATDWFVEPHLMLPFLRLFRAPA